jgi:glycosyltransferase involved in cell wall biosynthesis
MTKISNKEKKVYLFPIGFPYQIGKEVSFLENEIKYLADRFDKVIIIPEKTGGEYQKLDERILISEELSSYLERKLKYSFLRKLLNVLFKKVLFIELVKNPGIRKGYQIVNYLYKSHLVRDWVKININQQERQESIFYTYWFNNITTGLVLSNTCNRVITRAHGIDLYEERRGGYLPFRKYTIKRLNSIVLISNNGQRYLSAKYPDSISKFHISKLGVSRKWELKKQSSLSDVINIVSCSSLIELKRVDIIAEALVLAAKQSKGNKINWVHFGDGPLMNKVMKKLSKEDSNIEFNLAGNVINSDVHKFYATNKVDLFINFSTTEGLPMSIMEAQAYGIPVLASDVGGVSEIVSSKTGFLVNPDLSVEELARKIVEIINNDKFLDKIRDNCIINWQQNYNAEINYNAFIDILLGENTDSII